MKIHDINSSRWWANIFVFIAFAFVHNSYAFVIQQPSRITTTTRLYAGTKSDPIPQEADVIVIGSGLAGLSCAALTSYCDQNTVVLESHDTAGGAAHTWERRGFHFESGPSLYSGFSMDESPNPLKNIFQIIGEDCDWITYV